MLDGPVQWGELLTIFIMAVALGLDAFSLGIGIGLKGIRLRDIATIGSVVAFFHMMMPLMGLFTGQYVGYLLGHVATAAAGVLLLLLGGHMIYSSMRGEEKRSFDHRSAMGVLLFSLSVSIDSFSVGVSLGMFKVDPIVAVLSFGICGGIMSMLGLFLGRQASRRLSEYGETVGGAILFTFGLLFLF